MCGLLTPAFNIRIKSCIFLALILVCAFHAYAQPKNTRKDQNTNQPYVGKIRFTGNKIISDEELRQIMATTQHTSFFGLGLLGGAKKNFNQEEFDKDISLIKKLYTYKGYFFTDLNTLILRKSNGKKVDLKFLIRENQPSRVDKLEYDGLDNISEDLKTRYLNQKYVKVKDVFSIERLIEERNRTITFFKEYGYTFFHEDSIRIKVDTVGTHVGVHFRLSLPQRMKYGKIHVVINSPIKNVAKEQIFTKDRINTRIIGKEKISSDLIVSAIEFRPGDITRQSLEQRTLQNFGLTNIFSSIYMSPDSVRSGELFSTIYLETAPKHQIEPKLLIDNRYGALFFGSTLAYENKNTFGGAEQLLISGGYGTQTVYNNRLLTNLDQNEYTKVIPSEFNFKNSLVLPVLKKPGNFYSATTEYSTTTQPVLLSSRNGLLRGTYSARLNSSSRLNFDFFEVEWVQKDSLKGFNKLFKTDLARNIGIDPTKEKAVNAGIDSLLNTHINQSFRLRYNNTNRQLTSAKKTIWNINMLFEESGSLAWLIDKYIDTKTYSRFTNKEPQIFGTPYSQYIKLESGTSLVKNLSEQNQLAGRWTIGWMTPYGKAETTPEERRFYAGGTNSMRGWIFNTLGPGNSSSKAAANFGADIKVELSLEERLKFFKLFQQPSGITFFTDIGNIWNRNGPFAFTPGSLVKDYAWDCGFGLRLGSPIGPFRFDFAYKIHDPSEAKPWRISQWRIKDNIFNFGIGETF
ncbi:MAG: BamA/TamA family outer membrane protein [Chlorobiaceae bacterium]